MTEDRLEAFSDGVIARYSFFDPCYRGGLFFSVSAVDESRNECAMSAPLRGVAFVRDTTRQ